MKINVVGGSGFIGTRLCDRFESAGRDYSIIDICPSEKYSATCKSGDVRNLADLGNAVDGQIIINLAAVHRDDVRPVSLYQDVNVGGAENICAVADAQGIEKIIFTSSVAVYGFANPGTGEDGQISPFNEYGRTKWAAEQVFRKWQAKDASNRLLVVVRPTVVFGEGNRGNVYNLFQQIRSGFFLMIGKGENTKSMAYVENVAAFLEHCCDFTSGVHTINYVDKPDLSVAEIVDAAREAMGFPARSKVYVPYFVGHAAGVIADLVARVMNRALPISAIRVKKFCSTTHFNSAASDTGFDAPMSLNEGLQRTIHYEFIEDNSDNQVFQTE